MTHDEAKTLLKLCPPGDETNRDRPGLGAALDLAGSNPELAAWWEQERNFDAQFSRKLAALAPPAELLPTILRGGATIFFASRLIAESTGETLAELPALADEPDPKKSAVAALAAVWTPEKAPTPRRSPTRWLWVCILLAVVLLVWMLPIFIRFPGPSNPEGQVSAQLMEFIHYAEQRAALPPPPPSGQTLADMQKYLANHNAPNPLNPLAQYIPGGATPICVTVETWNAHPVTHYIFQSSPGITHLFIVNPADLPYAHATPERSVKKMDDFLVGTWSSAGFIYMTLEPQSRRP